jgi:hypothetical protein
MIRFGWFAPSDRNKVNTRRYTPCAAAHEFTHRSTVATRVVISIKVPKLIKIRLQADERSRVGSISVAGMTEPSNINKRTAKPMIEARSVETQY